MCGGWFKNGVGNIIYLLFYQNKKIIDIRFT